MKMKKTLIVLCPIAVIAMILFAMSVHGKATKSVAADSYEHYYNNTESDKDRSDDASEDINSTNESVSSTNISDSEVVDLDTNSDTILVNKSYSLNEDYEPSDLVVPNIKFSFTGNDPKKQLRQVAATAMENLFNAAKEEGLQLAGVSGYRSYKRQFEIYAVNLIKRGIDFTNQYSAMPGTSEHQTGLAMDISTASINYRLSDSFATTKEGIWVAEHCHEYGFVVRYQKDKTEVTGYSYEPWHIRYVGVELATYLTENNLTLDEYYGYNYSEQPQQDIDYDSFIQEYYIMKNMKPNSVTGNTGSYEIPDNEELLDEDINIEDDTEVEKDNENAESVDDEISDINNHTPTKPQKPSMESSTQNSESKPIKNPSNKPSEKPTQKPSDESIETPVENPSNESSDTPIQRPSTEPTEAPTDESLKKPTTDPSEEISPEPSIEPTPEPSNDIMTPSSESILSSPEPADSDSEAILPQ